jgi:hypothetical protein
MADFQSRLTRLNGPAAGPEGAPGVVAPSVARAFLWSWTILRPLCGSEPLTSPAVSWINEWMLAPILFDHLARAGWDELSTEAFSSLFEVALHAETLGAKPRATTHAPRRTAARRRPAREGTQPPLAWQELFGIPAAERFLRVHLFEGVRWFSKEALEVMLPCLALVQALDSERKLDIGPLLESAARSGYRWTDFLALIEPPRT